MTQQQIAARIAVLECRLNHLDARAPLRVTVKLGTELRALRALQA